MNGLLLLVYTICVMLMTLIMTRKEFDRVSIIFKIIVCMLGPISLFLAWVCGYIMFKKDSK